MFKHNYNGFIVIFGLMSIIIMEIDYNAMKIEIKIILIVIFTYTIIYVFVAFVHIDTYKNPSRVNRTK
jgi:presenilin-like A22 family membrane protease